MRAEAGRRRGTECCRALVEDGWVMQRRNTTEEGGDRNIWDCEKGEAREDKWHKGFILLRPLWFHFWGWPCKCHVGIPATNHSWDLPQSLWQSPTHPSYLSKPLQLLRAQPSYHSQWCWTFCRNKVRKIQQLLFCYAESFWNSPTGMSLSIRCLYESYYIINIAVRLNFNISIYCQEITTTLHCNLLVKCARKHFVLELMELNTSLPFPHALTLILCCSRDISCHLPTSQFVLLDSTYVFLAHKIGSSSRAEIWRTLMLLMSTFSVNIF